MSAIEEKSVKGGRNLGSIIKQGELKEYKQYLNRNRN
jgi:hypothetical protein